MEAALLDILVPGSFLPFLSRRLLLRKVGRQIVGREALHRVRSAAALGSKGCEREALQDSHSAQQAALCLKEVAYDTSTQRMCSMA